MGVNSCIQEFAANLPLRQTRVCI